MHRIETESPEITIFSRLAGQENAQLGDVPTFAAQHFSGNQSAMPATRGYQEQALTLTAADGFPLGGRCYRPAAETVPVAAVQINAALGVRQTLYARFAAWLAARGFVVLTYDYRGLGDSMPRDRLGIHARDWGLLDQEAALAYLQHNHPTLPRILVGHSIGGQIAGLSRALPHLAGVLFVSSSTGYWRNYPAPQRYGHLLLWYGLVPLLTTLFGYWPAKLLGAGENVPKGAVREWRDWCTSPDYLFDYFGRTLPVERNFYPEFRGPLHAVHFSDDTLVRRKGLDHLLRHFTNARKTVAEYTPAELNENKLGHFAFFRRKRAEDLWLRAEERFRTWAAAASPALPDANPNRRD